MLFSSVQSLSRVRLFATPWTATCQFSLSVTNFRSLLKHMSIESVMPSNHLIRCHPLLLLPSILPSIRVFSNESALRIRWPKYWSFSFNISPSNEHSGLISIRMKRSGERERYTQLNAEFQRIARRDKRDFLNEQCKEIEKNSSIGKIRDFSRKLELKGNMSFEDGHNKAQKW